MRTLTLSILFLINTLCFSQAEHSLFLQDQFKGGVSFSGVGIGYSGTTHATSELHIEPGSIIRKAYLFCAVQIYPQSGIADLIQPFEIKINDNLLVTDTLNPIFVNERYIAGSINEWTYYSLFAIDITEIIEPTDSEIHYEIPLQPVANNKYKFFCTYVLYENPTLPLINPCIYLNHERMWVPMVYELNSHNKMDLSYSVSLSTVVDWSVTIEDGFYMNVNSDSIGLMGGDDANTYGPEGSLTSGQFYQQNNTIYGLDDDTPDVWMDSSDALANIQSYIDDPNAFQLTFDYSGGYEPSHGVTFEDFPDGLSNGIWMMLVNYSPACDATMLDVAFSDTTICKGESIELIASGGTTYKWSPSAYLDCDTCATPICTAEKSLWYSCNITTEEGCSKTIPVYVGVNELPILSNIVIKGDTCGMDVGQVDIYTKDKTVTFTLNGITQTDMSFENIKGADYVLSVKDVRGCVLDTNITVPLFNNVKAGFLADNYIGEIPLDVQFLDQSENATNWIWYMNEDTLFDINPTYTFQQNDTFLITQVVYNTYPECSDTAYATIKTFKPIVIRIPNVITPNMDGRNDDFLIELAGGEHVTWNIVNRWGQLVDSGELEISLDQQEIYLWNGLEMNTELPVTDGVYFYDIVVNSPALVTKSYSGSLTVVK